MEMERFLRFCRDESAQDLVEYTMIITFLAVVSLWIFGSFMPSVVGIWGTGNSELSQASAVAGS